MCSSGSALDTPLEGIPLPRAVTKFEHRLGVSDNQLPGGKRTQNKGQFALSSYDQSILANGPPETGDGPAPGNPPPPPPAPPPSPSYQYAQPTYAAAPTYAYGQPAYAQPAYSYPQYQAYGAYQQSAYQYPQQYGYPAYAQQQQGQYAYPQQYQPAVQQAQAPQLPAAGGANYYDFSQANGKLAGANGDIASAAAFTEKPANQYSNLGWHPTLERMMGVHKSARNKGPRLALKGQLNGMKNLQKPHLSISPSVDPQQRVTAAHERLAAKARHGQGLAAMAHQNHHAFHFPAYMVKNSADTEQGGVLMGPNGEPKMKKIGPESSMAMGILIVIFVGLLGMAALLGWMHARKERKRNEMVALAGFVDD